MFHGVVNGAVTRLIYIAFPLLFSAIAGCTSHDSTAPDNPEDIPNQDQAADQGTDGIPDAADADGSNPVYATSITSLLTADLHAIETTAMGRLAVFLLVDNTPTRSLRRPM